MTDQRYTGPDGAKRLEMLEELASVVSAYIAVRTVRWLDVMAVSVSLDQDNERVDRLEEEWKEFGGRDYWAHWRPAR